MYAIDTIVKAHNYQQGQYMHVIDLDANGCCH